MFELENTVVRSIATFIATLLTSSVAITLLSGCGEKADGHAEENGSEVLTDEPPAKKQRTDGQSSPPPSTVLQNNEQSRWQSWQAYKHYINDVDCNTAVKRQRNSVSSYTEKLTCSQ